MLFADFNTKSDNKVTFFEFAPGVHKIVFIPSDSNRITVSRETHFIPSIRASVACLGESCEICKRNLSIMAENHNYKSDKHYLPKVPRYFAYIYNVTEKIVCPSCGKEDVILTQRIAVCPNCQTVIENPSPNPINKVQVIALSKSQIFEINAFITDRLKGEADLLTKHPLVMKVKPNPENERRKLISYDIDESVTVALPDISEYKPVYSYVVELTPDEQKKALEGVSIRDIYKMRSPSEQSKENSENSDELYFDSRISELFK